MDNDESRVFGTTSSAIGLPRAVIAIAVALAASGCYTFTTFSDGLADARCRRKSYDRA
jgi:hypothetical protein